ncbi:MAG: hypothetical protein CMD15_00295 [Flavobacteriales bacterium]|nr:hypothetical protein [Flavobacteriales bacterium]|tara:strand:+ start:2979 stop:3284 length:306 start_codon:yes stop_codon:yes gene_type:complete
MKRNLLLFFSILFIYSFSIAQDGINYQGAATDANGDELTTQNISIRASILSVTGEEIIVEDLSQYVGEYTKSIDLNEYAKGIYFLEIETNNGIVNKKLILQ